MSGPTDDVGRRPRAWPAAHEAGRELIDRLNTGWRVAGPEGRQASFKQRLARPLRRALAHLLRPQETFNSTLVQYINHAATLSARQQEMGDAAFAEVNALLAQLDVALDEVRRYRENLAARERRLDEVRQAQHETVTRDLRMSEALAARERRLHTVLAATRAEHTELSTSVGVLRQETRQLSTGLARRSGAGGATAVEEAVSRATQTGASTTPDAPCMRTAGSSSDALSHKYVGFEDAFRGSPETIRAGLAAYLPIFAGASDVLDVGCGRGEFLQLLREKGIAARGIDLNEAMVEVCREKGMAATRADALAYLHEQPDRSLGGLFAAQVVEHLEPAYLTQLLDAAFDKLRPGAAVVLETINPACWFAFFESYIRDITHVRPLHPDTLKFLLIASGFQHVHVQYSAPYPEHDKLQPVASSGVFADAAETLNANVEKMNRLLFTHLDYAAIARRP